MAPNLPHFHSLIKIFVGISTKKYCNSGMVQQIFTNPLFSSKFCFTHQAPTLFQKFGFIGGLRPSDHFQGKWAQNGLPDITLEPHIEFSQTTPHFVQNFVSHTELLVCFRNLALLGVWNLVTTFRANRLKIVYQTLLWSHPFNFHKQPLILFEILFRTPTCQFISEICLYWGPWTQ